MSHSFPAFLFVEANDENLPLAIGWSLPDGQIKHTLIQPLESWEGDPATLADYALETLHASGERPLDVIRELETDHFGDTVYVSGLNDDEAALNRLFNEYGMSPFVTVMPIETLYSGVDADEWRDMRSDLIQEQGLMPMQADHELLIMLMAHQRLTGDDSGIGSHDLDGYAYNMDD